MTSHSQVRHYGNGEVINMQNLEDEGGEEETILTISECNIQKTVFELQTILL
jgi:hypothetical protein